MSLEIFCGQKKRLISTWYRATVQLETVQVAFVSHAAQHHLVCGALIPGNCDKSWPKLSTNDGRASENPGTVI